MDDLEFIKRVAKIYNFKVTFDKELEKYIIEGDAKFTCNGFYWSSSETTEDFFYSLRDFFIEEGMEQYA